MTEADKLKIDRRFCGTEIEYSFDEPMSRRTTFKIGGLAAAVFFPRNMGQLREIIEFLNENQIPSEILGRGSNVLVSDRGINRAVIFTSGMDRVGMDSDGTVFAECGAPLTKVAMFACSQGLAGFEFAAGIPGTVGAGVFMNCGAYDGQMSDVLKFVDFISKNGAESGFTNAECEFEYRGSVFCKRSDLVITRAHIELKPGDKIAIADRIKEFSALRRQKQPVEFPSAGSVFKRPDGNYAGKMIQDCGLKGYTVGGARISDKHAGFIVNIGGATSDDVLRLIDIIKKRVFDEYGVELECEIRYIDY